MDLSLETYDLNTYVDSQRQHEWENVMSIEIDSLLKIHTWDLVP